MIRPVLPVLAAVALLAACSTDRPASSDAAMGGGATAAAASAASPGGLPAPRPFARPTGTAPGSIVSPPPTAAQRDQAQLMAACRTQAERTISQRDRGQIMREDERDSRLGTDVGTLGVRAPIDRMGRQFAVQRMAEECVELNRGPAPAATQPEPAAPASPPASSSSRSTRQR